MLALTICQPFAHLIVTPQLALPRGQVHKLCENRTWATPYRGPLLIHAGKSRGWLAESGWPAELEGDLVFGALVGICWLEDCIQPMRREGLILECPRQFKAKYDALGVNLDEHAHCVGPVGWMLGQRRAFAQPIAFRGGQGLFDVPDELVLPQIRKSGYPESKLQPRRELAGSRRFPAGPRF